MLKINNNNSPIVTINQDTTEQPYSNRLSIELESYNQFDVSKVVNSSGVTNNGDGTVTVTSYYNNVGIFKNLCPNLKVGDYIVYNSDTTSGNKFIYLSGPAHTYSFNTVYQVTQSMLNSQLAIYGTAGASASSPITNTISNIQVNKVTNLFNKDDITGVSSRSVYPYVNNTVFGIVNNSEITIRRGFSANRVFLNSNTPLYLEKGSYQVTFDYYVPSSESSLMYIAFVNDSKGSSNQIQYQTTLQPNKVDIYTSTNVVINVETSDDYFLAIQLSGNANNRLDMHLKIRNIQVFKKGNIPYTPYVSDIDNPNIKEYGKNLLSNHNLNLLQYVYSNGVYSVNSTAYYGYIRITENLKELSGKTLTFSENVLTYSDTNNSLVYLDIVYRYTDNSYTENVSEPFNGAGVYSVTTTLQANKQLQYIEIRCVRKGNDTSTLTATWNNIQLEFGNTPTSYESYIEPIDINPTANDITAFNPNTTLICSDSNVAMNVKPYVNTNSVLNINPTTATLECVEGVETTSGYNQVSDRSVFNTQQINERWKNTGFNLIPAVNRTVTDNQLTFELVNGLKLIINASIDLANKIQICSISNNSTAGGIAISTGRIYWHLNGTIGVSNFSDAGVSGLRTTDVLPYVFRNLYIIINDKPAEPGYTISYINADNGASASSKQLGDTIVIEDTINNISYTYKWGKFNSYVYCYLPETNNDILDFGNYYNNPPLAFNSSNQLVCDEFIETNNIITYPKQNVSYPVYYTSDNTYNTILNFNIGNNPISIGFTETLTNNNFRQLSLFLNNDDSCILNITNPPTPGDLPKDCIYTNNYYVNNYPAVTYMEIITYTTSSPYEFYVNYKGITQLYRAVDWKTVGNAYKLIYTPSGTAPQALQLPLEDRFTKQIGE